jgi:hypothetical protein
MSRNILTESGDILQTEGGFNLLTEPSTGTIPRLGTGLRPISKYYNQEVVLLDKTTGDGDPFTTDTGGYTEAFILDAAVNLAGSEQRFIGSDFVTRADYKVFCAPTTEVYEGRRARWNGDTFVIVEDPKNTLQRSHHLRFLLRRANA